MWRLFRALDDDDRGGFSRTRQVREDVGNLFGQRSLQHPSQDVQQEWKVGSLHFVQTLILKRQIEIHKEEKNIRLDELVIIKSDSDIQNKGQQRFGLVWCPGRG